MAVHIYEKAVKRIDSPIYAGMIEMPFDVEQPAFNSTSDGTGRSEPFAPNTNYIVVVADEDVQIKVSSGSPTATADSFPLSAGVPQAIWVTGGHLLAARTA